MSADVRLASNGRYWQAVWRDAAGVRRIKSLGPKAKISRAEAARLCRELAARFFAKPAAASAGRAPSLEAWRDQYLALRDDIKPGTRTLYEQTFARLIDRFGGSCAIDRVTPLAAEQWRVWLGGNADRGPDLSAASVARHVRDAKTAFGKAVRLGIITANPFADLRGNAPKAAKDWHIVSRDDLERILDACPNAAWRCLFALCRLAGLRRGEALRLTWADVDFAGLSLRVLPEPDGDGNRTEGTKQRVRHVPIEPRLCRVLLEAQEAAGSVPEVCPLSRWANVHRDAVATLRRAGMPAYAKPFHTLRKNLESEWLAKNPVMTVCYWLGHSPAVAAEHYHRPTAAEALRVTAESATNPTQNPTPEPSSARERPVL